MEFLIGSPRENNRVKISGVFFFLPPFLPLYLFFSQLLNEYSSNMIVLPIFILIFCCVASSTRLELILFRRIFLFSVWSFLSHFCYPNVPCTSHISAYIQLLSYLSWVILWRYRFGIFPGLAVIYLPCVQVIAFVYGRISRPLLLTSQSCNSLLVSHLNKYI